MAASRCTLSNVPRRPTCATPQGKEHDLNLTSIGLIQRKAFPNTTEDNPHCGRYGGSWLHLSSAKLLVDTIEAYQDTELDGSTIDTLLICVATKPKVAVLLRISTRIDRRFLSKI